MPAECFNLKVGLSETFVICLVVFSLSPSDILDK